MLLKISDHNATRGLPVGEDAYTIGRDRDVREAPLASHGGGGEGGEGGEWRPVLVLNAASSDFVKTTRVEQIHSNNHCVCRQ